MFINNAAGSGGEPDQQVREITQAFRDVGVDAAVEAVDPQRLPEAMRAEWGRGVDAIVVAGGDGTISSAAGVAVDGDIVLGVLPMGTFNHFAKDLGMKPDLDAATRFLADAEITPVDVGEVNGVIFVNNASIGVYPRMVRERQDSTPSFATVLVGGTPTNTFETRHSYQRNLQDPRATP